MKKYTKRVVSILSILAFLIVTTVHINVNAYENITPADITAYIGSETNTKVLNCLFVDDVPVPYVSITDYMLLSRDEEMSVNKSDDGTYKIEGKKGYIIVDPANDTIYFPEAEMFLYGEDTDTPDFSIKTFYVGDVNGCTLDLKKYGIKIG